MATEIWDNIYILLSITSQGDAPSVPLIAHKRTQILLIFKQMENNEKVQ